MELLRRILVRFSIAEKVAFSILFVLALVGVVQLVLVRAAGGNETLIGLAFLGPAVIGSGFAGIITALVARRRARRLVQALDAIARGDLEERLPDAPDSEFVAVQHAFNTMGGALAEARAKLERADAERRRLFADLAHELATPASAMLGLVDTLAEPSLCATEADRARLMSALDGEATRLARLVADLRELATLDEPDVRVEREPTNLAALAGRVVDRPPFAGHVELIGSAVTVSADPLRLEQVLVNLLKNALRYAGTGAVRVEVSAAGAVARLTVEDAGPGVADEQLARLGERLFRGDPSRDRRTGGHGLGLAIVRAIVEKHGGTITFAHAKLGGLAVEIELPRDA